MDFSVPGVGVFVATLVGFVALARIYFGAHLPLDVVGGLGLGLTERVTLEQLSLPVRRCTSRVDDERGQSWLQRQVTSEVRELGLQDGELGDLWCPAKPIDAASLSNSCVGGEVIQENLHSPRASDV